MFNYIKKVKTNLWDGILQQEINFDNGLNLVSGANGTGKTQLLNFIYNNKDNKDIVSFNDESTKVITAFSPKRNAEKQLVEQIQSQIGLSKKQKKQLINNIRQRISDANFQVINSIAYYLQNESQILVDSSGKTREEATNIVREEYQSIFNKLFDYKLIFSWDSDNAKPQAKILKDNQELSFTDLSAGENALLSLVCAIYFSREDTDVYLIDEPEVHLNWSLEEKLFDFLLWFCEKNTKQVIAVTHSRIIALDKFRQKTKFLYWEERKILVSDTFTPNMISDIAGDTIKIIQGISTRQKLVYVEDESQKIIIDEITKILTLDVNVQIVPGGCEFVKSFSRNFKNLPIDNVYFLIDGDNKPLSDLEKIEYKNLIQLHKYCIENYLLDIDVLNLLEPLDWESEIKASVNLIDTRNRPAIKPIQIALDKSVGIVELIDYIDGAEIFEKLATKRKSDKKKKYELMQEIIQKIPTGDLLGNYFVELKFLKN